MSIEANSQYLYNVDINILHSIYKALMILCLFFNNVDYFVSLYCALTFNCLYIYLGTP